MPEPRELHPFSLDMGSLHLDGDFTVRKQQIDPKGSSVLESANGSPPGPVQSPEQSPPLNSEGSVITPPESPETKPTPSSPESGNLETNASAEKVLTLPITKTPEHLAIPLPPPVL